MKMIRTTVLILCVASVTLAIPLEDPLLPGALPATTSSKFAPFKEISGRIINGSPATRGQFPWQAALYLYRSSGMFFCGGALISSNWILTAAHCVEGVLAITAYLGVVSLYDSSGVAAAVTRAIPHPNYNSQTLANDIALLQLWTSVATNSYISTIPLSSSSLGSGVSVTVSGFGKTSDSIFSSMSQTLNYVGLTTITNALCSSTYGISFGSEVVCARGNTIESTCNGDSGGPLVTGSGSNAIHVGVVSFVHFNGCARGYPAGFTRTAAFRKWITANSGV